MQQDAFYAKGCLYTVLLLTPLLLLLLQLLLLLVRLDSHCVALCASILLLATCTDSNGRQRSSVLIPVRR